MQRRGVKWTPRWAVWSRSFAVVGCLGSSTIWWVWAARKCERKTSFRPPTLGFPPGHVSFHTGGAQSSPRLTGVITLSDAFWRSNTVLGAGPRERTQWNDNRPRSLPPAPLNTPWFHRPTTRLRREAGTHPRVMALTFRVKATQRRPHQVGMIEEHGHPQPMSYLYFRRF